jgi:hypothetical protein
MKTRRAVSLVELLVVMTACSVVLTMSASLIHRIMHAQTKTREFFDVERSALRLSSQFRRDVHAASNATPAEAGDGVFLRLQFADGQAVEYHRAKGQITRIKSLEGGTAAREEFKFPANVALKVEEEAEPRRLVLSLTANPIDTPDAGTKPVWNAHAIPVSFRAAAVLGSERRLARPNIGGEVIQ